MSERETSQLTDELKCRISTNQKFGDNDLTSWLIDRLQLQKGEKLLDIGCGTGEHLIPFAKKIREDYACTGIDISGKSLKEADNSSQKEGVKIKFVQKDMDKLGSFIKPHCYDTITAIYAAYYSNNVRVFLHNLNRMLKPDGRIAIAGPYLGNSKEWFDFLYQFMKLPQRVVKSTTTFMSEEILPFALENFDIVRCFKFVNNISIPTFEDLQQYWQSNVYYDKRYNPEFERYARIHFNQNKSFCFKKIALLVIMKNK